MTPEEANAQLQQLAQRRAIANAMLQGSVGASRDWGQDRYQHSPFEALANLAATYLNKKNLGKADTEISNAQKARQAEIAKALTDYETAQQGTVADPGVSAPYAPPGRPAQSVGTETLYDTPPGTNVVPAFRRLANTAVGPDKLAEAKVMAALTPKKPITLGAGDTLLDPNTLKPIATNPKDNAEDRQLVNIVDPKAPSGYRTIKRSQWEEGQQEYQKPNQSILASNALTDKALDIAAQRWGTTGELPPGSSRSPVQAAKIQNRWAELSEANGDTAGAAAARMAAGHSAKLGLNALTKQKSLTGAFEKTAQKNIDLTLELSNKLDRSGSPIINKGILNWRQNITGDPDTAAFVNALTAARTEYAKVLSGATGATGITDAARHEAEDLFSKISNAETLRTVFDVAKREMANRMTSFDEQSAELAQQLGGNAKTGESAAERAKRLGL